MEASVNAGMKFIQVDAIVFRACQNSTCPHFQTMDCAHAYLEDRGTISYWHRNPLRRLLFSAKKRLSRGDS